MIKYIFISLGLISLTLGILGIIVPGLPTTPFILLAAYLFSKSSPLLHKKLLDNKYLGRYLKKLEEGISIKGLLISMTIMWLMISISIFIAFKENTNMQYLMLSLGLIGTFAQIIVYYRKKSKKQKAFIIEISKPIEKT